MSAPEERVAAHVAAILDGRRPRRLDGPQEATAAVGAANRLAAALAPDPDAAFVARLHDRLRQDLERPQARLSRRSLLLAGGAVAAGAAGLAAARTIVTPAPAAAPAAAARLIPDGAAWRFAANLDDLPEGEAVAFATEHMLLLLVRSGAAVRALAGTCTHLGCRLQPAAGAIACPCHRTRFALDGRVLEHELPAAPPTLPEVPARVVDGRVEVLTV